MMLYVMIDVLAILCDVCIGYVLLKRMFEGSNNIKLIVSSFIYMVVVLIIDLMSFSMVAYYTGASVEYICTDYTDIRMMSVIMSKCILVGLFFCYKKLDMVIYLPVLIISLLVLTFTYYIAQMDLNKDEMNTWMISSILFCVLIFAVTGYFMAAKYVVEKKHNQEKQLIEQKIDSMKQSLNEQENTLNIWRKSVHDYKNILYALQSMIAQNKMDEVSEFIKKEIEKVNNGPGIVSTGNNVIDTIVNAKSMIAKGKNIEFSINIAVPNDCYISDVHLANIIGNLLDNAIEAQDKEEKKYVYIQFSLVKSFLIIKVINTCTHVPNDLSTTKQDSNLHGIGLKSVREIVEKYNGEFSIVFDDEQAIAIATFSVMKKA